MKIFVIELTAWWDYCSYTVQDSVTNDAKNGQEQICHEHIVLKQAEGDRWEVIACSFVAVSDVDDRELVVTSYSDECDVDGFHDRWTPPTQIIRGSCRVTYTDKLRFNAPNEDALREFIAHLGFSSHNPANV